MSVSSYLANEAYFSDITVKTVIRVLPTRWRRKPAGIEITSLSPYMYTYVSRYRSTIRYDRKEIFLRWLKT